MDNPRITIVSPDKRQLGEIERALRESTHGNSTLTIEGALPRLGTLIKQLAADILIVDVDGDDGAELAPLEQIGQLHPQTAIVVLSKRQSPAFLIQAMRLGVREVLSSSVDTVALDAAIERITTKAGLSTAQSAKVLAFTSCKGGSGSTFLAANLAYALAAQGDSKVALFDLNLQFGDALLFLSETKATRTLSDVVRDIHRLDAAFLKTSMLNVTPTLSVLAAPEDPARGMEVKPEHIDMLLTMARPHYDYIILDVGNSVDAPTIRALDQADLIYAVLQADLPFIRRTKHMLEVFRTLDYPAHKVELILNRHEKSGDIGVKAIEAALGRRVQRTVPNHYAAATASVNQGIPIAKLAGSSPISRSLVEWSAQLQDKPVHENSNWITRVLKRA